MHMAMDCGFVVSNNQAMFPQEKTNLFRFYLDQINASSELGLKIYLKVEQHAVNLNVLVVV